jgi:hypothetical protein
LNDQPSRHEQLRFAVWLTIALSGPAMRLLREK